MNTREYFADLEARAAAYGGSHEAAMLASVADDMAQAGKLREERNRWRRDEENQRFEACDLRKKNRLLQLAVVALAALLASAVLALFEK